MPSERIQKRIDHLLDQADAAAEANHWQSVRTHARAVLIADPDTPDAKTLLAMADELAPEESYGTAANVPQTQAEEEKYPEPVKGTFLPERPLVGLLPKRWSPSKAILMPHAQLSLLGSRWSGSSKSTKQLAHTLLRL